MSRTLLAAALIAGGVASSSLVLTGPAQAEEAVCPLERTIVQAGLGWESADFHAEVVSLVLEHGFGCTVDKVPVETLPALQGLARGDLDIMMEVWVANAEEPWLAGLEAGTVTDLGVNFPDAPQGWFVPRYLVEGPDAPAPDLRTVADLARYTELFADPEEPTRGRFYNCVTGWGCEQTNTRKLTAYGLDELYTNFRPGSGGAFSAEILSRVARQRPIVFYYWAPSGVFGKIGDDIVMLEEPEYDAEIWAELQSSDNPTRAVAYPNAPVHIGGNTEFVEAAPAIADFLRAYETTTAETSAAIAYMEDNDAEARDAAAHFLSTTTAWEGWLPAEVAARVRAAL
ncbi:MAG: ABC transporter substrate-binding protein [Hyphomicrobiaceae bacterium]|nr:ABC transporter substrate-binding protein [Hyphomicrobiaceae bacterium]